jgi:VWFA-related protein
MMCGGARLCLARLICLLSLSLSVRAQNPPNKEQPNQDQAIRVTTSLIDIRAVVTDRDGRVVTDLKQEDFELIENKQPQEISFFSIVRVGSGAKSASATEKGDPAKPPAAEAARRPNPAASPARTIVLFVDNIHLGDANLLFAKQALKRFIAERLTDDDLVALVTSGGTLGLFSQFTRDRRLLSYAVDKVGARGPNRNTLFTPYLAGQVDRGDRQALDFAILIIQAEDGISGPRQMMESLAQARSRQVLAEASYQRGQTLATLRALTDGMAKLPGQRMIVMLSDGFTLLDRGGSFDTQGLQSVTSRAAVSGVIIYTIDAKGLDPPGITDVAQRGPVGSPLAQSFLSGERSDLQNGMNALARDTGGEPIRNSNDLSAGMRRALDENSYYYALGYYPASEEEPNKFRRLTIRVKNHPEYKVRAQQGYLPATLAKVKAEEAKTPAERIRQAIIAPLAIADIGVFATADFIETEADEAQVTLQIYIEGSKLQYKVEQDRHRFALEMATFVFDASGNQVGGNQTTISSNLMADGYQRGQKEGYRYTTRLPLKPGVYQVRVGVREPETERLGTASAWVEVPDLKRKKLNLSNLLLTDAQNDDLGSQLGKENMALQGGTRQGIRVFRQNQMLGYYLRVYNPGKTEVMYQNEITSGEKIIAQGDWKPVPAPTNNTKGIELGRMFPLTDITPGLYELRVRVREGTSKKMIERTISFEVIK